MTSRRVAGPRRDALIAVATFAIALAVAATARYQLVEPAGLAHACVDTPATATCRIRALVIALFRHQAPGWLAAVAGLSSWLLARRLDRQGAGETRLGGHGIDEAGIDEAGINEGGVASHSVDSCSVDEHSVDDPSVGERAAGGHGLAKPASTAMPDSTAPIAPIAPIAPTAPTAPTAPLARWRLIQMIGLVAIASGAVGLVLYSFDPAAAGLVLGAIALARVAAIRHGARTSR